MPPSERLGALRASKRTLVMGVLNVTTDSFSDGGLWLDPDRARDHARAMIRQGAAIIDVGAESTRPGAQRVPEPVERERIVHTLRAVRGFARSAGVFLSVDTTRASVAAAALEEGADILNDVSGGRMDAGMAPLVASHGCLYIVQHWRGWLGRNADPASGPSTRPAAHAGVGAGDSDYPHGVVEDTLAELSAQVRAVLACGVDPAQIVVDPGLGFSKPGPAFNYPILAQLERFRSLGYPVLLGASRKGFLSRTLQEGRNRAARPDADHPGSGRSSAERPGNGRLDTATAAFSLLAAQKGAWAVRVHDVQATCDALAVLEEERKYRRDAGEGD